MNFNLKKINPTSYLPTEKKTALYYIEDNSWTRKEDELTEILANKIGVYHAMTKSPTLSIRTVHATKITTPLAVVMENSGILLY